LDQFVAVYNQQRPHRALARRATPAVAYQDRPKAAATARRDHHTHQRVRHDRIDTDGKVTLRVNGRLHHIGIGRTAPEPPSCCSSKTSTSASSTRPPASCCAS
jgi:hypothetical protein